MSQPMSPPFKRIAITLAAMAISLTSVSFAATIPAVTVLTPPITKHLGAPLRMAFDPAGNFFVSDPRTGGVSKFDSLGRFQSTIPTSKPSQGIAINSAGQLLVSQGDSVAILDQNGTLLKRLGSGMGQFKKANGIAVDAAGYIYVADTMDNNVKIFTSAGRFVKTIGTKGNGLGEFSMPTSVTYEKANNQIAVADTQNGRIQFFSATTYAPVKEIGSFGYGPLKFKSPGGVAFDYTSTGALNRMYVVDTYLNEIQVIDPTDTGTFLTRIGSNGLASGQLTVPVDATFDPLTKRLAIVNASGKISMFGVDGGSQATDDAPLLGVYPIPYVVNTPFATVTGTVPSSASVSADSNTGATVSVSYSSSNGWTSTVSGLVPGVNLLTITATDTTGQTSKQTVSITYRP